MQATPITSDIGTTTPLLVAESISKSFPGVRALQQVTFELRPGEIHALVGENGAGKSTLMKVLAGVHQADSGRVLLAGREVTINGPLSAHRQGISTIHQEFFLMPHLTVAQNIFIGREPRLGPAFLVNDAKLNRDAAALLARLGVALDPATPVDRLSVAAQQMVEIAKALSFDARVLIMDEPTAALTATEAETLFGLMRAFVTPATGIIYISHRMEEIRRLADRITVLRDGRLVATDEARALPIRKVIRLMVGREIAADLRPAPKHTPQPVALAVHHLSTHDLVRDVSFDLHRGEVLGFAGLMGAGRTETARAIVGADPKTAGDVVIDGRRVSIRTPADAVREGIGYLSEDRKKFGLILPQDLSWNVGLPSLPLLNRFGLVRDRAIGNVTKGFMKSLGIKTPSARQQVRNLSGGNQQKVVLAKWLARDCDILIFDEPTRGIDVGAKEEVYALLDDLVRAGKSIIVISSEMEEVLRLADRIVVMCNGRVTGTLDSAEATQEKIMELATQFDLATQDIREGTP